jgi:hypothetical protein
VSLAVARVVGALSADRANDYARSFSSWDAAWYATVHTTPFNVTIHNYSAHSKDVFLHTAVFRQAHTAEPLLSALWSEEVNFCVMAIFAAVMTQNLTLAESWTPRLDEALAKFYPAEVVQSVGNYMLATYKMQKQAEAQQKQPGLSQMM